MSMTRILGIVFSLFSLLVACQQPSADGQAQDFALMGETMGTTYSVKYADPQSRNFQAAIDSALLALNMEVSTYIPDAVISRFNQSSSGIPITGSLSNKGHFAKNLALSIEYSKQTEGAFQPTLMPLVNYWGFGYTEKRAVTQIDSLVVDSLMQFVGLDKIQIKPNSYGKTLAGVQLDFSAVAKGYGVDMIGQMLADAGLKNYYVEIGGETLAHGLSPRGDSWKVGINAPDPNALQNEFISITPLVDRALATSGNYRNYYDVEGEKYGHTINPYTGFPEKSNLLSASVFAPTCAAADAYATAFMVMGFEKAMEKATSLTQVEAYFVVGNSDGTMQTHFTAGLQDIFLQK